MLKIGITGGIGSGKSTVCALFASLGTPIYDADAAAKWLMQNDPYMRQQLIARFGTETYDDNGNLNRPRLAQIVFGDAQKLHLLESIVHPAVLLHAQIWLDQYQHLPYTIKEAALLFESGSYQQLDKIVLVYAPLELRIARTMKRDAATREMVLARIEKQMPDEEKLKRADYIIYNDEQHELLPQVLQLHKMFLEHNTRTHWSY